VLAVDRLADLGGVLADISPATMQRLDAALPPIWSRANPVDIAGDADGARYGVAFEALLDDPGNDAVLVMNVPTALASASDAAQAVVEVASKQRGRVVAPKPAFAVWVGSGAAASFERVGIPDYATDRDAVGGFMHLVRYREALDALMATPPSMPADFSPDLGAARTVIEGALPLAQLDPVAATRLLAAYAIPRRLAGARGRSGSRPIAAGRRDRGGQVHPPTRTSRRWAACA
jgi:acetyltransferase